MRRADKDRALRCLGYRCARPPSSPFERTACKSWRLKVQDGCRVDDAWPDETIWRRRFELACRSAGFEYAKARVVLWTYDGAPHESDAL